MKKTNNIAGVIACKTTAQAIEQLKNINPTIDLVEVRLDHIKDITQKNLEKILNAKTKPIIITNRPVSDGGKFVGTAKERIRLLEKAIDLKADFVDIELSAGSEIIKKLVIAKNETKIICSSHNMKQVPGNLDDLFQKMKLTNADIIKIACMGNSIEDNLKIFDLVKKAKQQNQAIIAIIMGRLGKISRILSGMFGAFISTYVPIGKIATAKGQMSLEEVQQICKLLK